MAGAGSAAWRAASFSRSARSQRFECFDLIARQGDFVIGHEVVLALIFLVPQHPPGRVRAETGGLDGRLLAGDLCPVLAGELVGLFELRVGRLQGRFRFVRLEFGVFIVEPQERLASRNRLILVDENFRDATRSQRGQRADAVLDIDVADAHHAFFVASRRRPIRHPHETEIATCHK